MSLQSDEFLAAQAIEAGDYEKALRLLRLLAERNSEYALLSLGWLYETGAVGRPSSEAARSFYEHAADQGSATAYLYLGRLLWHTGNQTGARAAFERGAHLGNEDSKSELARLAACVDKDLVREVLRAPSYEETVRLLWPLAERNSQTALLVLGYIYETGVTGDADWNVARSFYERAASQGSARGCFELGRLLNDQGEDALARSAFQAGADLDDLPSMSRLGTMLIEKGGCPGDVETGVAWLEKAAANGHSLSRRKLLSMEAHNAKSIFKRIGIAIKAILLGARGATEDLTDPISEIFRRS